MYLSTSDEYQDVPLASVFGTLAMAIAVRLPLVVAPLFLVNKVYGQGMKGKNPYEREIKLPRDAPLPWALLLLLLRPRGAWRRACADGSRTITGCWPSSHHCVTALIPPLRDGPRPTTACWLSTPPTAGRWHSPVRWRATARPELTKPPRAPCAPSAARSCRSSRCRSSRVWWRGRWCASRPAADRTIDCLADRTIDCLEKL
eukprot:6868473-Prymnesium_polylepis.1